MYALFKQQMQSQSSTTKWPTEAERGVMQLQTFYEQLNTGVAPDNESRHKFHKLHIMTL